MTHQPPCILHHTLGTMYLLRIYQRGWIENLLCSWADGHVRGHWLVLNGLNGISFNQELAKWENSVQYTYLIDQSDRS